MVKKEKLSTKVTGFFRNWLSSIGSKRGKGKKMYKIVKSWIRIKTLGIPQLKNLYHRFQV